MRKWRMVYFMSVCITCLVICQGCKKDFLDKKPASDITTPKSLADYQKLLENNSLILSAGALPQLSCDDYCFIDDRSWLNTNTATERNAYVWAKDIFGGEVARADWNMPYRVVFYANAVLDGLQSFAVNAASTTEYNNLKGWALFLRSYALYDLVRNFSPAYDSATAATDLGIPLKLQANVNTIVPRASVKNTYQQIIGDLQQAAVLVEPVLPGSNRNRPCKTAVYALLARIFLSMNAYDNAAVYATNCLAFYDTLTDYRDIATNIPMPFITTPAEVIFINGIVPGYDVLFATTSNAAIAVDSNLLQSYDANDLRLLIYFRKDPSGNYVAKRGYMGQASFFPFAGLATDEMYLIKAECLARQNDVTNAMNVLNRLLRNRYQKDTFNGLGASSPQEALRLVLLERRKELVWRGLRWSDLKRLNKENANIVLTHVVNGQVYTLLPNSALYVFPIPDDEIALSGIQQNNR